MKPAPIQTSSASTADEDIVEQAHPGHGIPSQDPSAAAQTPLTPEEAEREATSVYVGGGALAGAAAGAAVGIAAGGPVGALVGGTVGAVAGALGGQAAGTLAPPDSADADKSAPPVPAK
jgi:phage tail tape-measure protein